MKKAIILLMSMLLPLLADAYEAQVDGIYYNFSYPSHTAEVTSYASDNNNIIAYSGDVSIPSEVTYNGVKFSVTSIAHEAFQYCSALTSVTIPNSITTIGYAAFKECSRLTSVIIPEGVTEISDQTFYGCSSMTSVSIPNSVSIIKSFVFYGCNKLTSVTIPDGVPSISSYTFQFCI